MGRGKLHSKNPAEIQKSESTSKNTYREYSIGMTCGALLMSGVNPFLMFKMLRK